MEPGGVHRWSGRRKSSVGILRSVEGLGSSRLLPLHRWNDGEGGTAKEMRGEQAEKRIGQRTEEDLGTRLPPPPSRKGTGTPSPPCSFNELATGTCRPARRQQ